MRKKIKYGVTTYKRSKMIWDEFYPKSLYFFYKKRLPENDIIFLKYVKIFFKKYKLHFKEKEIYNILKEHNLIIKYTKKDKKEISRKLTLFVLRSKLNYPNLY